MLARWRAIRRIKVPAGPTRKGFTVVGVCSEKLNKVVAGQLRVSCYAFPNVSRINLAADEDSEPIFGDVQNHHC